MKREDSPGCPSFERLSRAFSEGEEPELGEHLAGCGACRALWAELQRMRTAAQAIEWDAPSEARKTELKAQLLLASKYVAPSPGPWRAVAAVSTAVALAASVLLFVRASGPTTAAPGPTTGPGALAITTRSAPVAELTPATATNPRGARLRHGARAEVEHYRRSDAEAGRGEELVRLTDGKLAVELEPLEAHERFRLLTLDAELESRAASFEVEVEAQRLHAVLVESGMVEVRPHEGVPRILRAGDRWSAPERPVEPAARMDADTPHASRAVEAARVEAGPFVEAPRRARAPRSAPEPEVGEVPAPLEAARVKPSPSSDGPRRARAPRSAFEPETQELPALLEATELEVPSVETLFTRGFGAFERGRLLSAIRDFSRIMETAPDDPLAKDAAYWRAIALTKLDDPDAEAALSQVIVSQGSSARSGQIALILGLRQAARRATSEARLNLLRAEASGSPEVRERAREALRGLGPSGPSAGPER